MTEPRPAALNSLIFFTSFCVLAYEINFTRVFACAQWHNLSPVIITMALLGFGVSGSIITLMTQKITVCLPRYLYAASVLFPISMCIGFIVSARLDFNPFEMVFNPGQVMRMMLYFILMGVSFFLGAAIICMALLRYRISLTYFINLLGSASGVVFVLGASSWLHPIDLMAVIIMIAMIPGILAAIGQTVKIKAGLLGIILLTVILLSASYVFFDLKQVSQYKAVSTALTLPDARVVHERYSPLGVTQVVQARGLRLTGGLSLASPFQIPVQKAIFVNGEGASPISSYTGNSQDIAYLQYITSFLPFYLAEPEKKERMLVVGSGGGAAILKAVLAGFEHVDALEINPDVIRLMKSEFASFSGNIYARTNVRVFNQEARNFIRHTKNRYDLIELSLVDSYNSAASGVYGLNESYLYTVDAIKEYLGCLRPCGTLALTRWNVTPPRDNLKLLNTVARAYVEVTGENLRNHLIVIRSLQTLTIMVMKSGVSPDMRDRAKSFARERLFDLVWYPGVGPGEVNQHIRLQSPVYYHAVKELTGRNPDAFIDGYDFDISAPTDNRPYFYNFFKPRVLGLIRTFGASQIPLTEWGYLLLLVILAPVLIFSFILILAPVFILKKGPSRGKGKIFAYFALTGAGFFFVEMPLIQKMILFLGQPVYSVSVIIASLLVFSGIGSYFSDRIFPARIRGVSATFLAAGLILAYMICLDSILRELVHLGNAGRLCLTAALMAPLGFFMGIPFPAGLERVQGLDSGLTAWAWGINGFFSVISILAATLTAVVFGFKTVFILASGFYLFAGIGWALAFGGTGHKRCSMPGFFDQICL